MVNFCMMMLIAFVGVVCGRRVAQKPVSKNRNNTFYPLVEATDNEGVSYPVEGSSTSTKRTWPKDTKDDGTPCDLAIKLKAAGNSSDTCTIATIRYRFAEQMLPVEGSEALKEAMEVVNKELDDCVQFKHYSAMDGKKDKRHYGVEYSFFGIEYNKRGTCANSVGKSDKKNILKISTRCFYRGVLLHELGHMLGLKHSQARWDSFEWMRLQRPNVMQGRLRQFTPAQRTMGWDNYNGFKNEVWPNFTIPYDGQSIEQYPMYHFTKNGKATLQPTARLQKYWDKLSEEAGVPAGMNPHTGEKWKGGQLDYYSGYDLKMLRKMYHCRSPPNQTYSWKPLAWDVLRKKPLDVAKTDGWSACSAPCGGGVQRRVIVCVGDTDDKTYEDDRCHGHTPEARRSCNMDACPAKTDQVDWQDAMGKGCSDYDAEKCKMWGFLGANAYCLKTCPRGERIKGGTLQKTSPEWTKDRGSLVHCRVASCARVKGDMVAPNDRDPNNYLINAWQADIKGAIPRSMTLQQCKDKCKQNPECVAISITFSNLGPAAGKETGFERLAHCQLFSQCDRYEYLGARFHTYWYHRGGEAYYKDGEYSDINQPAQPNTAAFMCPEETDIEVEEVLQIEEAAKLNPGPELESPDKFPTSTTSQPAMGQETETGAWLPTEPANDPRENSTKSTPRQKFKLMPGKSLEIESGEETLVLTRMKKD